ncbi:hypothetical protein BGLA2_950002 [Burkholderia gladioli]|uniref:hypothetical protein n=1 Tax=Burkholderia gladioli TaxID=28095 RepID=UPI00163F6AFB|nr:hypothetical protein [Burkholderia gladioli]CAG9239575.1 hypothetical protein BGLA2_950002 [Burkholderia gladioli]
MHHRLRARAWWAGGGWSLGPLLERRPDIEESMRQHLAAASTHVFISMFEMQLSAADMAIDVLSQVME